ncbi:hypothetical protein E2C01_102162 [Portunus trituberculatus]|uniref:Uncharacterized protein n=1 Tax=Portunus trituberculatus TaxID=210409 RepID=A0A5B7KNK3_PORTR|nr:hypothetical protein [Portunus trituberculatus]
MEHKEHEGDARRGGEMNTGSGRPPQCCTAPDIQPRCTTDAPQNTAQVTHEAKNTTRTHNKEGKNRQQIRNQCNTMYFINRVSGAPWN